MLKSCISISFTLACSSIKGSVLLNQTAHSIRLFNCKYSEKPGGDKLLLDEYKIICMLNREQLEKVGLVYSIGSYRKY